MDEPLKAHTPNEMPCYLLVTHCAECGRGPLEPQVPADPPAEPPQDPDRPEVSVRARCRRCGHEHSFRFRCQHDVPALGDDPDCINPTEEPSRIIDLAQWVGLYYHFADASGSAPSPVESRRLARRAALCLSEALKFYSSDEMPPASAFFCSESSAAAFRANRANYARTRLRELQALLPAAAHHPSSDRSAKASSHPWWRFWEK